MGTGTGQDGERAQGCGPVRSGRREGTAVARCLTLLPACCLAPLQEAEEAEERREAEEAARQAAVVEAERQRLLREAAHLCDHLPKGVARTAAELSLLTGGRDELRGAAAMPAGSAGAYSPVQAPGQWAAQPHGGGWEGTAGGHEPPPGAGAPVGGAGAAGTYAGLGW